MPPSEPTATTDLFISYSHIDNEPWGSRQRRWVSELHKGLATRLAMLLGREARIWRDEKIAGNDELTERILSELNDSTALVCVLSPRYLRSEWCIRELQEFCRRKKGAGSGASKPVFKIVKTPIDLTQQPAEVKGLIGYDFFQEIASGKVHEFYPSRAENDQASRNFWQKIDDLAQDVDPILESSDNGPERGGTDNGRKTVYLAVTTSDVNRARDSIRRELGQRGYRVVPDGSLLLGAEELLPAIEADLKQACLTVHPVGARYGFIPEGDHRSIVELQIEAATTNNGHSHHVIWVPPEAVPPSEDKQKEFIERLRSEYTEKADTELLDQRPLEELKTRLVEKLEVRPKPPARSVLKGLRVYVICELADVPVLTPLAQYLRVQGLSVSLQLHEGDLKEREKDHRDVLVRCDAVLVYYAGGGPAWLRGKQRDLWDARDWGRTKEMRAQAVFVAPPYTLEHAQSVLDEFLVLGGRADSGPEDLGPFLDQLRGGQS